MKNIYKKIILATFPFFACSCSAQQSDILSTDEQNTENTTIIDDTTESSTEDETSDSTETMQKDYNVLFIGNSFTYFNSLDVIVHNIADNIGINMTTKRYAVGAHSLMEDADPNDSLGKLVQNDLKENQYTDVVLQEKSNYPYNHYKDFEAGVKGMVNIINETQENARISLYETWGYNSENLTSPPTEMEGTIRFNTKMIARKFSLNIVYVGEAFTYIIENYPDINLFGSDNKHPNYVGSYLAGLVFVATLADTHVTEVSFLGDGHQNEQGNVERINKNTLEILKTVAETVVYGNH